MNYMLFIGVSVEVPFFTSGSSYIYLSLSDIVNCLLSPLSSSCGCRTLTSFHNVVDPSDAFPTDVFPTDAVPTYVFSNVVVASVFVELLLDLVAWTLH